MTSNLDLEHEHDLDNDDRPVGRVLSHREALTLFGAAGALWLSGCTTGNSNNATSPSGSAPANTVTTASTSANSTTSTATTATTASAASPTTAASATAADVLPACVVSIGVQLD